LLWGKSQLEQHDSIPGRPEIEPLRAVSGPSRCHFSPLHGKVEAIPSPIGDLKLWKNGKKKRPIDRHRNACQYSIV
jgi:hypothetical protein